MKQKTFGPANDDIPVDEMALAMALQNAKSRGLKPTKNSYYRTADGIPILWSPFEGVGHEDQFKAGSCCALGAMWLEHDSAEQIQNWTSTAVGDGNDSMRDEWDDVVRDCGESFGHTFQEAMKDV